jgi:hypothetical protein
VQTPEDLNAAFADALANDRGELHMLHLLGAAGAGPWADLEAPVAHKLLDAFANLVQVGLQQHWQQQGLPGYPLTCLSGNDLVQCTSDGWSR